MQTKLFAENDAATLIAGGKLTTTITNDEARKANFHNIHVNGRIQDDVVGTHFNRGFIVLICVDNADYSPGSFLTSNDLEQAQGLVIAAKKWSLFGTASLHTAGSIFDFEMDIKTSRNCPKEGRLILLVTNDASSGGSVVVSSLLSTNITQA